MPTQSFNNVHGTGPAFITTQPVPSRVSSPATLRAIQVNGSTPAWASQLAKDMESVSKSVATQGVPTALTPTPGVSYMTKFDLRQVENITMQIGTNAVDAWVEISMLQALWKGDLYNR